MTLSEVDMDSQQICSYAELLFELPLKEVEETLRTKFISDKDRDRLSAILKAVEQSCLKYNAQCDTALLQRAGRVIFKELDYSKFAADETPARTEYRLKTLFTQASKIRDINPYKIIYCQVLTDGNLRNDHEQKVKYEDASRLVENIYEELKLNLGLSDKETCEMFEKCSTLISKISTYKIAEIYNLLEKKLIIFDRETNKGYHFFEEDEVREILKTNPSLFTSSSAKILEAFDYLKTKAAKIAKPNETTSRFVAEYDILIDWLKDNSSLLSINASKMKDKEDLFDAINREQGTNLSQAFNGLLGSSTNIAILNDIPYEKIAQNLRKNIETLKTIFPIDLVANYIERNPYVLGFNSNKFEKLLLSLAEEDKRKPDQNLVQTFFAAGKSIFDGSSEFSTERVLLKLKKGDYAKPLDLDNMTIPQKISKFVEIFLNGDRSVERRISELIWEKENKDKNGERILRAKIYEVGQDISRLPSVLKSDLFSIVDRKRKIYQLVEDIRSIQSMRLKLAASTNLLEVNKIEKQNAQDVVNLVKLIYDAYEEKVEQVEKKYVGANILYDSIMTYLVKSFGEIEPISSLFEREISQKYIESLKAAYQVVEDSQETIFGEKMRVVGVETKLFPDLKNLTREISRDDISMPQIVFEKQITHEKE